MTFRAVDIIRNDLKVLAGNITINSNQLLINVDDLHYMKGDVISLQFGFNINGSTASDTLSGMAGRDLIRGFSGNDVIHGKAGNDVLYGGMGNDKLYGGAGRDILNGDAGNDFLYGNAGNDTLNGGSGNDRLEGGAGADKLYGGSGKDIFVFKWVKESTASAIGRDTIYDFSQKEKDRIDLKAIDADTTIKKNQDFDFIGTKKFSKNAGELRYEKKNGDTFIYGDVNGDGKADFSVRLDSIVNLRESDFIL
ncbi:putative secreted protein (type I secretion substrate) [Shinella granuli]|uniref:Putative secreted protein (Type I secretion substrate) n=2 Tax=Shinella granuli TaxID=323621 RepID=A0A4R2D0V4_SHIGR|nr:putative secreted protein (type I secretion substrate) [Shinella granuli]